MLYQANRKLLRIELIGGQKSEIDLNKLLSTKAESIDAVRLFLSPTGQHCLLSICYDDPSSSPECFYVCKKKLISLKTKGHHVTQVGWNMKAEQSGTSSSSYYCLVGTSRGLLFELELLNTDENKWSLMSSSMDSSLRCMYDLRSEHCMMTINGMIEPEQCSVTGIHFDYIPINTLATTQLYFIVVTTPLQIFHFSGTTDSFGSECRPPAFTNCKVQSFPDNFQSSLFDVFLNFDQRPTGLAWLMDQGVYYSPLEFQSTDNYNDITIRNRIISLKSVLQTESPVSFALTPHHLLLLFKSHLKVVCILNGQTVMEDKFLDAYGAALGVTRDPLKGTVWAYSERAIYRYKITQEDRNLIDIYLQQKDFPNARLCAKGELLKLNRINEQEAQHLFDQEKYESILSL